MFSLTLSFTFSVDFPQPNKETPVPNNSPSTQHSSHPRSPPPSQHLFTTPRPPHPEALNPQARHLSPFPSPMPAKRSYQPFYPADTSSASLSPAAQNLQRSTRENLHQRRACENGGSNDPIILRTLEIATRGLEKRSLARRRQTMGRSAGFATTGECPWPSGGSRGDDDRGRRRMRSPRKSGSTTASTSTTTTTAGAGDSGTWTSDFSLFNAETVLQGGRGRDGRGDSEQQVYSPLGVRVPTVTPTTTGVATATGENDNNHNSKNDDDDEESWDFLTTPPPSTPSTTDPLLELTRDGDESPESFAPFRRSGNPSPSSRSGMVSPSSGDQNWMEDFLHHQEKEGEEEDDDTSLSSANEQKKRQHQFLRGRSGKSRVGGGTDDLSPSSFFSQREQEQQHPRFGSESNPPRASREVHEVIQKYAMPRETEQERGIHWKSRTQGEVDSSGFSDDDGWSVVGVGGDGRDDGWEMV
ncbi:hypothetical protein KC318_g8857 [Hortaea werneckii]|nr:hypothetical protein KC334_g10140 [Hortaea werneckii]KAI7003162.1 hypothetical protein KC355_g9366 [Hortaea werneckii]KAI7662447.1 hypothetical protein KC318_g8857 [Hortaea werneckii]